MGSGRRTVSFTTQGRFSRSAPPPLSALLGVLQTPPGAVRRRAPPYCPPPVRIVRPVFKPSVGLMVPMCRKW
ncbi:hypothetical protein SFR_2194 [Streptomyces sp. FR-008]|nr:hypothetical protein SFR_2194 [Streptomyces sp. FR-008]